MRLPTQLITTFLVLASASADVARGQWTAPTAAYPPVATAPIAANSYYAGSTVTGAKELLDRKIGYLDKNTDALQAQIQAKQENLRAVVSTMQGKIMAAKRQQ